MHALFTLALAASGAHWAWATSSLEKVRPGAAVEHRAQVELELGRGECQATQVVAQAGEPLFEVRVAASPLAGPAGAKLEVALSREAYLDVQQASNVEGRVGPWPDILIPEVDPIAHEHRRAFPVDAAANQPVVAWAEVCAPQNAAPGRYTGELVATARGQAAVHLPLVVEVLHYTLPATSSLPTAFGFSGLSAAHAHGLDANDPDAVIAVSQQYGKLALHYRISLFGMSMAAPPFHLRDGKVDVDFRDYDRELAPLMDGPAHFTAIDLRGPAGKVSDDVRIQYYKATVAHLKEHGWLDRVFLYAPDEPKPEQFPQVQKVAALAHQADPRIRVLVTSAKQAGLEGAADLWVPNIVCSFRRPEGPGCPRMADLEAYRDDRKRGAKLWWYQSCMSHGCGPTAGLDAQILSGWPSYMVDHPATLNRVMGVAAYKYGVDGELYFSTTEAYDKDPWKDLWRFHGNGDGTLFYPGTPDRIGGSTAVPLASLRLAQIRDGLQDYEVLKLADANGLNALAQQTANALVPEPWKIERDVAAWERARHVLVRALDAKAGAR